jgi:hypothetical protein
MARHGSVNFNCTVLPLSALERCTVNVIKQYLAQLTTTAIEELLYEEW